MNTERKKYPRTFHLPWSKGISSDDKVTTDLSTFEGAEIVVTEKMDGENTTMYRDYIHARSLDSKNHPSRNWVKNMWWEISYLIDEAYRICGENLYARHSIGYDDLESYFLGFSVWEYDTCLDWDMTLLILEDLGIRPVRTLYRGIYDEKLLRDLADNNDDATAEGYVVRTAGSFKYEEFRQNVAKFVRANHVQTDTHWSKTEIVKNGAKTS